MWSTLYKKIKFGPEIEEILLYLEAYDLDRNEEKLIQKKKMITRKYQMMITT